MATVTTITECQTNTGLICLNNGTSSISIQENFPIFDSNFPVDYLVDLLITSMNGFTSGETIEVLIDNVSLGSFSVGTTPDKAIWLSELIGLTSREILSSKPITQNIELKFSSNKLLKFILVSAKASDYVSAITTYNNILTISNNYVLAETEIQSRDESSVGAIADAVSNSKTEITGNNTNVITIKNTFPIWGTALPKAFVIDNLIIFSKLLPMNTEIYIKKDGIPIKTYKTTTNLKCTYLSDILGVSKELLYTKVNEEYELNFVYPQFINNQILTGELTDFSVASVMATQLQQNIFELSNSHTLDDAPVNTNDCNFIVTYDSYDRSIKSAELQLNNQQSITLSFLTDNSESSPIPLVKLSNLDNLYNTEISLVMDGQAIQDYLTIIRDFARKRNELEYQYKTNK